MQIPQDKTRRLELATAAALSLAMVGLIVLVQTLSEMRPQVVLDRLEPIAVFPDFASIDDIDVKKQQFFDYLQDYVVAENERLTALREELAAYAEIVNGDVPLSVPEREWVMSLAQTYRVDTTRRTEQEVVNELMLRVDVLPVSLALAQAANESGWGTSRFALQGNNVFGQWCYEEGCGIVPRRRRDGASHEVKSFDSVLESVQGYFLNINSHPSYRYLRQLRAQMRQRGQKFDPMVLAFGLGRYSERGEHYVDEIQNIILQNNLQRRDNF